MIVQKFESKDNTSSRIFLHANTQKILFEHITSFFLATYKDCNSNSLSINHVTVYL